MDELRLVRRDEHSLIVATDGGEEYRLIVDEVVLAELRQLARLIERGTRSGVRVNPREVQGLVRAGRSRAEIAELTGLEESDIARYEEPVLAERRYMVELAQTVPVRTSPTEEDEQQFGEVIEERLLALGAGAPDWMSWRDEEAGWMVGVEFVSRDVEHRAVWAFDHRKRLLAPVTPDAEKLSQQGDVGDRLIPKLRAVDAHERFDSGAFDPSPAEPADESAPATEVRVAPDHPSTGSIPIVGLDSDSDFAVRQHIEERAIKTPTAELPDLGQTADLLDALRRRRGEREAAAAPGATPTEADADTAAPHARSDRAETAGDPAGSDPEPAAPRVLDFGRSRSDAASPSEDAAPFALLDPSEPAGSRVPEAEPAPSDREKERGERDRRRGRASIPSWDDILFGTRSDEDPA